MPADVANANFIALQADLAGQYFFEREIGRGGMGVVYLAREVQLDRPVAIKVLPPQYAVRPELRERFLREAKTAAQLSHPNIVPIFHVDEVGSFVFIVMAYIEGETIGQRVRARGPMPPAVAARALREVAWALAYAHARGIVHRDVKPDNILLEKDTGRALVTDFGIAHVAQARALTDAGIVMGTAQFMSPEQAAGEPLDGRSDLYSLGVVAHFALTGKLPFDGPTVPSILSMHMTQPPPPLPPTVPRRLAQVVNGCLAKEPPQRPATGEALADALAASTEMRTQTPAPIRVWLTKGDAIRPLYGIWAIICLPAIATFNRMALPMIAAPIAFHFAFRYSEMRRILAAGFGIEDVRLGLRSYNEARREELSYDFAHEPFILARAARLGTFVMLAAAAVATVALARTPDVDFLGFWIEMFATTATLACAGALFGLAFPGKRVLKSEIGELRLRYWNGRLGELFARVAGVGLRRSGGQQQGSVHRPTEIAIGLAADALYETLPRTAKRELREVPTIIRRLEGEAGAMRAEIARLDRSIGELGEPSAALIARHESLPSDAVAQIDARRGAAVAELRTARERACRRLGIAVAALESIRLDLLRLQAGTASVETITGILDGARRMSREVEILVESQEGAARAAPPPLTASSPPEGAASR
ncbi:MAG TPA: serine/threonine-protein kinase [Gemmatimonadaceae bacterium]|nr:serine/threonine-protein kinase [Gemmatimonadaceae bacterium]